MGLALYGDIFYRNVMASGVVPQISLILGNCAGGHVYSPALTDFNLMVDCSSAMMITGPDVIKTVTGEDITIEDLGGARAHNSKSGVAHFMSETEEDALELAKTLLSFLPSNNLEEAPVFDGVDALSELPLTHLDTIIPDSNNAPYDMKSIITSVLDEADFLEVQALWAPSIVCGFGRIEGRSVGVVANNPMQFA
ncbi:MAG: propionyl-CoA carboxylase beta chain, partial [Actinomycetota bacterium]|nr:propionyl-CoA carboxylase beta chain [Actinomycetota bacterium]